MSFDTSREPVLNKIVPSFHLTLTQRHNQMPGDSLQERLVHERYLESGHTLDVFRLRPGK